ncbi:lipocalin-like domain-containing protein [Sphingomonas bacterium]|uniref:lipocalin-like domain-containing protein n=1 Tax=Sphingomonas bacterium TaxID=1895847 RepID=UPI0015774F2F|nr:lipocalin-like domain-containing protein [Sphingomonas bacterium]
MDDQRHRIVGAWDLLGEEDVDAQGVPVHDPVPRHGRVIYSDDGHVSVVSTPVARHPARSIGARPVLTGATDADILAAVAGVAAYAGRYAIDGDIVSHHVEVALNPNAIGTTLTRRFAIDGDRLTFFAAPIHGGAFLRIRWRRAGPSAI